MQHFLIAGNTRVGSTWLTASLHSLPGIFCTREIRWRMPYHDKELLVHTYVDGTTRSMKERLESWLITSGKMDETKAVGAKLKFDPYGYVPPEAFSKLRKIIEDDVHIIFLRRPYFEIYETWHAFGIRHLANPNSKKRRAERDKKSGGKNSSDSNRFQTVHQAPLAPSRINLTRNGKILSRITQVFNKTDEYFEKSINHPIDDAIDELFGLFFNDVFIWSMIKENARAEIINYRDIRSRFISIARRFLPDISADECRESIERSPTLKIEPENIQFVFPDAGLKAVSDYLDNIFNKIISGDMSIDDVVEHCADEGQIRFTVPGLAAVLEDFEETKGLSPGSKPTSNRVMRLFRRKTSTGQWISRRPIYVPTAYV